MKVFNFLAFYLITYLSLISRETSLSSVCPRTSQSKYRNSADANGDSEIRHNHITKYLVWV
jgi:hypothetical protein